MPLENNETGNLTEMDERHIARIVKENQKDAFDSIPGGKSGTLAILAVVVFFAKDYFGDFKQNSDQLTQVSSQQLLILKELSLVNKTVDDLKQKTEKRYTYEDATKDFSMIQRQLDTQGEILKTRGVWINDTTRRVDLLEKDAADKRAE